MGLSDSGFSHAAVIERDPITCETIRENARRGTIAAWPLFEDDVRTFDFKALGGQVDILAAGPPCQPFSRGGKRLGRHDTRDMFPDTIRAVRELRPKTFVIENVKGLEAIAAGNYLEYIRLQLQHPEEERLPGEKWKTHLSRLERLHTGGKETFGYKLVTRTVNAADYGVPQRRERVFMVGVRSDTGIEFSFPEPTHSFQALAREKWKTADYWERAGIAKRRRPQIPKYLEDKLDGIVSTPEAARKPWVTVREALADLPAPSRESKPFEHHVFIDGARVYDGHTGSVLDEPSKTLKAGSHGVPGGENMMVRDDGTVRYFTIRECARLQTFPDNYVFSGKWARLVRQIGNAVPVKLAYVVSAALAEAITRSADAKRKSNARRN